MILPITNLTYKIIDSVYNIINSGWRNHESDDLVINKLKNFKENELKFYLKKDLHILDYVIQLIKKITYFDNKYNSLKNKIPEFEDWMY